MMADLAAQIRSRQNLILKALPVPATASDKKLLERATAIARGHYQTDTRYLGEPLPLYYLELARLTAHDIGLDLVAVISALLSGITEESPAWELVDDLGDPSVKEVIKGLSRITELRGKDFAGQAENFRKLLLSLADDGRVILIALAERLLLMRRLDWLPEKERLTMASESYFLFAPLAHRLGYYNIKSEMEDLAMKLMEPEEFNIIETRLKQTTTSRNRLIREFLQPVREKLDAQGIRYEIKSRTKSIYSIWQKMKRQGVPFEEVYDIFAIRIVVDTEPDKEKSSCWQVYSVVADLYQPDPSRLRDWISVPKTNGYESLHTTVATPSGRWVEVQIRSRRMDDIAEKGLAAHFRYKGVRGEGGLDNWMAQMREVLGAVEKEGSDFLGEIRPGLYAEEVFVFTPKGELRQLPMGATLLDFAFDIHTEVGARCVGGKINGRNVQLKQKLKNGDHVSVITSSKQTPKRDWLSFVVTNKARSKIKQELNEERYRLAADGKEMLTRRLKNWKITYGDATVVKLLNEYELKTAQDLYFNIAIGELDLLQIKKVLLRPDDDHEERPARAAALQEADEPVSDGDYLIIDEKVEGLDYKLAKCCNPVFGDPVFGFVTVFEGIKVHRTICHNAGFLMNSYPYRIIKTRWTRLDAAKGFFATVKMSGVENIGIVTRLSEILNEQKGIAVRNFTYHMNNGLFEGRIDLLVPNINALYGIIKKIQSVKGINRAFRVGN